MKFRSTMNDSVPMKEFNNIVTILSKLSKECVLRLTTKTVYFIVSDDNCGPQSPTIWWQLDRASFFSDYQIEGVDENHQDIYLGFGTGNLARSLMALKQSAKSIKIKLTKKQSPCLTLEIESLSLNLMHTREVVHDIPVTVIPRMSWKEFNEPSIQKYDISIEMPSIKQLKYTVDRMRNMSSDIILKANSLGCFTLQIMTDLATVSSRFQNLYVENFNDNYNEDDDEETNGFVTCRIDIKIFSNYLTANQVNREKLICSIVHNQMVNLFLEKEGIFIFQCYIPSIYK